MSDYVALSGGIDSTACALMQPDAALVFTDTGWEFPELYAHLDRIEQVTGREIVRISHPKWSGGLPEYIAHQRFLPNFRARFCTVIFKVEAMNLYFADKLPARVAVGLRADEPARVGNTTELEGLSYYYPLRELGMTRADCIRVCAEHDLLPRYPVYMARGGCTGCYFKRKSEVRAMQVLAPDVLDSLQALEESVQAERGSYFHMFPNIGMSIAEFRQQPFLFDQTEVYAESAADLEATSCGMFCHR